VRAGFQDENESNGYFIYEKYFILSEREQQASQRRKKKRKKKRRVMHVCS